jgi:hypothetical protein
LSFFFFSSIFQLLKSKSVVVEDFRSRFRCGPQVNSSPAVADALLGPLVDDLIDLQVRRYFNRPEGGSTIEAEDKERTGASSARESNGWELLFDGAARV